MSDRRRPANEPGGAHAARADMTDFSSFLISLGAAALHHLGEIPDPEGEAPTKDLSLAKYNIDLMGLLREKTKGNLTPAEESLFERLLYDVRMRYVAAQKTK